MTTLDRYDELLRKLLVPASITSPARRPDSVTLLYAPSFHPETSISIVDLDDPSVFVATLDRSAWAHLDVVTGQFTRSAQPRDHVEPNVSLESLSIDRASARAWIDRFIASAASHRTPTRAVHLDGMPVRGEICQDERIDRVERWSPQLDGDPAERAMADLVTFARERVRWRSSETGLANIASYLR